MKKVTAISAMFFLLAMAGCDNELSNGQDDAETEGENEGLVEICDNGMDDDGDSLVDERDPDCQSDAGEDEDVVEEEEEEVPPGEICDNGIDDDGDGYVDETDPDCQEADADEDGDQDVVEDAVEDDSTEDVPPETEEDVVEDDAVEDVPVEDSSEDLVEDPPEDLTEEDAAEEEPMVECTPVDGELILAWNTNVSWIFDHIRAECWAQGEFGTLDYWHDGHCDIYDEELGCEPHIAWDQIGGTADAAETNAYQISIALAYPPCTKVWCNFVAFDIYDPDEVPDSGDEIIILQLYALGGYNPSTGLFSVENGILTAVSGTCTIAMSADPEPPGPEEDIGPSANFYGQAPECTP